MDGRSNTVGQGLTQEMIFVGKGIDTVTLQVKHAHHLVIENQRDGQFRAGIFRGKR